MKIFFVNKLKLYIYNGLASFIRYHSNNIAVIFTMAALLFLYSCGTTKKINTSEPKSKVSKEAILKSIDFNQENPQIVNGINYSDSFYFQGLRAMQEEEYSKAIEHYKKFVALNPTVPGAYYNIANIYANHLGNLENALSYSATAYYLNEENKWYRTLYADLLAMNGNFFEAGKLYDDYISKGNYEKEYFIKEIYYYIRAGKLNEALFSIDKMDNFTDLDDIAVEEIRLEVHKANNDLKNTEKSLQRLVQLDTTSNDYKLVLAEFYQNDDKKSKADSVYNSISFDKESEEGRMDYLITLMQKKDTVQISKIIKEAYKKDNTDTAQIMILQNALVSFSDKYPYFIPFYINTLEQYADDENASFIVSEVLSDYYASLGGNDEKFKTYSKLALKKGSKSIPLYGSLIAHYFSKDQADSIIDLSHKTLESKDSFSIANYGLGMAYFTKKQNDSATKYFERAIQDLNDEYTDAYRAEIWTILGDLYNYDSNYVKSFNAYDSAIHYDPKNATALNNYAYFLSVRNERLKFAEEISAKSLALDPDQPSFLDTYGWIKYQLGDYEEAKEYIRKAIDLSANPSAELWEHLGDIELKLNNKEKALDYWKLAIDSGGDADALQKKIDEYEG